MLFVSYAFLVAGSRLLHKKSMIKITLRDFTTASSATYSQNFRPRTTAQQVLNVYQRLHGHGVIVDTDGCTILDEEELTAGREYFYEICPGISCLILFLF